jgi:hypothetical protein
VIFAVAKAAAGVVEEAVSRNNSCWSRVPFASCLTRFQIRLPNMPFDSAS